MNPKLLPRKAAADYLGLSKSTLARWACQRTGPRFHKVGKQALYKIDDLDAFIAMQAVEPVASKTWSAGASG